MSKREFIESRTEMEQILQEETIGYLGLSVEGKPYVVPLNYSYVKRKILFHCSLTGMKLDHIRQNPQVCFSVGRQSGEIRRHAEGDPCRRAVGRRRAADRYLHCGQHDLCALSGDGEARDGERRRRTHRRDRLRRAHRHGGLRHHRD